MLAIEVYEEGHGLLEGGGRGFIVYTLSCVQAHVKQKNDVMAAMYCLEIAHRLKVHYI